MIFNRSENYFFHLFNVHSANDVRQIEIHTAGTFVRGTICLDVEIAVVKLKKC
jgi:hypothetical protein